MTVSQRVAPRDEWLRERVQLLAAEKELSRRRDELAAARVTAEGLEPAPVSGQQERLENLWNRFV